MSRALTEPAAISPEGEWAGIKSSGEGIIVGRHNPAGSWRARQDGGSWLDAPGASTNAFGLSFSLGAATQAPTLGFSTTQAATEWVWSHSQTDGTPQQVTAMKLDAHHAMTLYDPAHPDRPAIVLDPAGHSHLEPQGDLSMGEFTGGQLPAQP